ncbi:radical SAM protein [Chitinophaga qingshengii]|uniref:Radical SAM protein n=1 Tax=Chitinophaga qingshengii TaxID=1569794 RepID=A0ABR7TFV1_9BACT|nr:radical SAM/SPASM domain-containing protein [Chitinophaga qingshengii]MBC9929266.1 radical SAM protein [Chitinophaga qingshengii]
MYQTDLPYLQVEPTTHCNFTCGFCVGRHMTQQHMTLETFREVVSAVTNLEHISIQGEGEPLLNPHFFDMIALVRQLHPDARISFISNGSLFSSENIKRLLSLGIYRIMVSIESPDMDKFREIRGGKLEKVIRGIGALLELRNEMRLREPLIGFAVTVMKKTMSDYKGIIALYHELGLDGGMTCQFLQNMDIYTAFYNDDMKAQVLNDLDLEWMEEVVGADPEVTALLAPQPGNPNFYSGLMSKPSEGCPWLTHGLYVNRNGEASGCCYMKDVQTDGLGKVTPATIADVLTERYHIQAELLDGNIPHGCKGCTVAQAIQTRILLQR